MKKYLSAIGNHPLVPRRPLARQFIKFAMVGVINTIVDFSVYALCLSVLHFHYLVANAVSFLVAASNSYLINRRWTFRSDDPRWRRQATKYFTVLGIGFGLNELLLYMFVEHGQLSKIMGKVVAILIVLFWNFTANKFWTFSRRPAEPANPAAGTPNAGI